MKNFILFFLLLMSITVVAQKNSKFKDRFSNTRFSTGLVFSNVLSLKKAYKDNRWKRGFYFSVGKDFRVSKRMRLEGDLVYQERKALEVFAFSAVHGPNEKYFGEDSRHSGGYKITYIKYPTSPQSENFEAEVDKPFDNFKYLGFELIPVLEYGQKLKIRVGLGVYATFLLNRKKLVFGKDDFPRFKHLFEPPQTAFYRVKYMLADGGFLPKLSFSYVLNDKAIIGLTGKYYNSHSILNATLIELCWLQANLRWSTFLAGLDFFYSF